MPLMVYEALAEPVPVSRVWLDDPGKEGGVYEVVGWSSDAGGTPVPAQYVPVSDSGQAMVHLVFGGDWASASGPRARQGDGTRRMLSSTASHT